MTMSQDGNTKSRGPRDSPLMLPEIENFSIVLGGPLYQLLRKARLEDSVENLLIRRVVVITGIIWIPLLVLCLFERSLIAGVAVPFLLDVETHARFLVAVPLLILAELLVHQRMRKIIPQFVERDLLPEDSLERFREAVASAVRLRNSIPAELLLIAIVYPLGFYIRADVLALESSTWYAQIENGRAIQTGAGLWFKWVSNPIMQFLLLRWYYRLMIWTRFLWQISRIRFRLIPTHPDRSAGLGFLSPSAHSLSPLLAAHGAAVAGLAANRIFHEGASLPDFKLEIMLLVFLVLLLVLGPLTLFSPQILAAKRQGSREYGILASEYTRDFDRRWLRSKDRDGEALLGASDIQSLADLGNAYAVIKEITGLPFTRNTVVQLGLVTIVPFVPLLLTMFPLEVLLDRIVGAVF